MLTRSAAADQIRQLGVEPGGTVMVHSSFRSLGPVDGGADALIDAFLDVLGPEGTLLLPTFNFTSWTEDHYWDVLETPSQMGALTEVARQRDGAGRTPHPIYSFAVLGARRDAFLACDDAEAYGEDSAFGLFHRLDGLVVSLGLHFNSTFSIHHYVERRVGTDYRRTKHFGGVYLGYDREARVKTYTMYVRNGDGVKTWIVPGMDVLRDRGTLREGALGEAQVYSCPADQFVREMGEIVRDRPELLHETVPTRFG